jgi:hypothetical protein
MEKPFADLHIHSYYSDGSMSPEEIVEAAAENGVGLLAIADHNVLEGSINVKSLCRANDIQYLSAVEIDTLDKDGFQHILAYGFDISNSMFSDFIKHLRFMLDEMSVKLIERMKTDYSSVSISDYFEYKYDRQLGGWKGINYLLDKGITSSLKDGMSFYSTYDVLRNSAGFSTIAATAYRVKMAGGYSVLSHPGELFDTSDIEGFKDEIRRIISYGVDGIECYYPNNSDTVTQACLDVCNEDDLIITAGSDCHGTFIENRVGEMDIPISKLRLKELNDKII